MKLNFYKSDGITQLEEPLTTNQTLPIMDLIAEEQLEKVPVTTEDLNDSTVDFLLGDAIAEVYGPSCKCQQTEDKIEEESAVQTGVVPISTETFEMKQPMVQSMTSTATRQPESCN